jgi:hypothetical protein
MSMYLDPWFITVAIFALFAAFMLGRREGMNGR